MYSTVRSTSLRNARTSTSRLRSVVVVALGLTTSNARMAGTVPVRRRRYSPGMVAGGNSQGGAVDETLPGTLRAAVLLIAAEAAAVGVVAAFLVYEDLTASATSLAGALFVTGFAVAAAAALAALARALHRRRGGARGLAIVLQLMLLPIGYYMVTGGLAWLGWPLMALGLAGGGVAGEPGDDPRARAGRARQPTARSDLSAPARTSSPKGVCQKEQASRNVVSLAPFCP